MTSTTSSGGSPWGSRLYGAFWLALILFAVSGLLVVYTLPAWMMVLIVLGGILAGSLLFVLRWVFKRQSAEFSAGRSFIAFACAGILASLGFAAAPLYYLAFWVQSGPIAVPLVHFSNGKKQVVFQGMQHVASEDFFKSVVFDLQKALVDGYTLFYEGVQPVAGRPDLDEWFNKTLRGSDTDLSAGYVKLADNCGLKFQLTYFQPLLADQAANPSRHVTADVNYLEMKNEYDRLLASEPAFASAIAARAAAPKKDAGTDPVLPLLEAISSATPDQKKLVGIVCRGVLGMAVSGQSGNKHNPTDRIILDLRNRALAKFVADSNAEKIYITYGAAHFPGFFSELQRLDPKFAISAVKGVRPMTLPDDVKLARSAVMNAAPTK